MVFIIIYSVNTAFKYDWNGKLDGCIRKYNICKRDRIIRNRLVFVVVVMLFYVHSKQLWSCRDGQLT